MLLMVPPLPERAFRPARLGSTFVNDPIGTAACAMLDPDQPPSQIRPYICSELESVSSGHDDTDSSTESGPDGQWRHDRPTWAT